MRTLRVAGATAVLLITAGAGTASASTLSAAPDPTSDADAIAHYVAAPGEVNDVSVAPIDYYTVRVTDPGAVIATGENCTSIDAHTAECTGPPQRLGRRYIRTMDVQAGDMDDHVESVGPLSPGLRPANGGPGDDTLVGSLDLGDQLDGGGGHDTLHGRGNAETLTDGDAPGAVDADVLDGGGGRDTVSYATRGAPVFVDLGNPRPDGERGEDDTLIAIQSVVGGSGDDRLTGAGGTNRLEGMRGDDRVEGRGGADDLHGGAGRDTVLGRLGDDSLYGGSGRDRLFGAQGADRLDPGSGGDDLDCGRAADIAGNPHAADFLEPGCDQVFYGHGGDSFLAGAYPLKRHRASVDFRIGCPRPDELDGQSRPIRGSLRLREAGGRKRALGTGTITRRAGRRCGDDPPAARGVTVRVELTSLGRRLARRGKGVRSTVVLRGHHLPHRDWTIELHAG
jgi:RTX calcium-binding nonapeptide repeat (4 copies)